MPAPDFCAQPYRMRNIRVFTTGLFDASVDFQRGVFTVLMKLHLKFPFGVDWYKRERFREKCLRQIRRYWHGSYRLYFIDETLHRYDLNVEIVVNMVDDPGQAHTVIDVQSIALGRSWVKDDGPHKNKCVLYADAVKRRPKGRVTELGWKVVLKGTRENLLKKQAVKDLDRVVRTLRFAPHSLTLQFPMSIQTIVTAYQRHQELRPLIGLILTGYRQEGEEREIGLARAQFVRSLLAAHISDALLQVADGGVGSATVDVTLDAVSVQNVLNIESDFPIAAHEFGHMLGLLDEYPDELGVSVHGELKYQAQAGFLTLSRDAYRSGITVPPFNANTLSLMSLGDKVLPYHYLAFVEAMRLMQADFFGGHQSWAYANMNVDWVRNIEAQTYVDPTPIPVPDEPEPNAFYL